MNYTCGNKKHCLKISETDGGIISLQYNGVELLEPATKAFSLRLRRIEDGNELTVTSLDFHDFRRMENICCWSGYTGDEKFSVECKVVFDGSFFRFRPSVHNLPPGYWLELIDFPLISVNESRDLLWSHYGGCMVQEPFKRKREEKHIGFPGSTDLNVYPGCCQLQFFASFAENCGLYFSADDYSHSTKALELGDNGTGQVEMRMECTCGKLGMNGNFELPFDLLLGGFDGDWHDACEIYRKWLEKDPVMQQKPAHAGWMDKSPIFVVYPVCGDGKITAEANNFQPYDKMGPRIKELSEALDSPIMVHLMRWEHNGPWMPPYHWPPVGDIDSFFRFRDILHESGNYLGLYGSGTAYTRKSEIHDFSDEKNFYENHLENYMTKGPKGEITADICKNLREGTEICITEEWGRKVLLNEVRLAAENGIDFYQIMDQNHGSVAFACYSREHQHPPLPGVWQTEAMTRFIDEMNDEVSKCSSDMVLGAENAVGAPYLIGLPVNDVRSSHIYGTPIPAAAYVYHKYSNNFMGNHAFPWMHIDCMACPDNLLFRIATGFSQGEFLSIPLMDSGEISWGSTADWNQRGPKQAPVIQLLKTLNRTRRNYAKFLIHGDMQKPFANVSCGEFIMKYFRGDEVYPSILSSSWMAPDQSKAQFLVNFREEEERIEVTPCMPCDVSIAGKIETYGKLFSIILPPLSVTVLNYR